MGRTILWDIADTARRRREAVALRFANDTVSYGELWEEALCICRLIGSRSRGELRFGVPHGKRAA